MPSLIRVRYVRNEARVVQNKLFSLPTCVSQDLVRKNMEVLYILPIDLTCTGDVSYHVMQWPSFVEG